MASPPAKRQRRAKIVLSDEDESSGEAPLPLRTSGNNSSRPAKSAKGNSTGAATILESTALKRKSPVKPSPKSSPEKSKQKSRAKKEPEKSKSLHTFFERATEEQRWTRKVETPAQTADDGDFGDDIIDDDSFDEALSELADRKGAASSTKSSFSAANQAVDSSQRHTTVSSQRFVKPTIPVKRLSDSSQKISESAKDEDHRPWSDRYAPLNLEELAVNKKKAGDVQKWLSDVLSGRDRRRILVLKGPSGSGKSTTLSLLSKTLGVQLVAWSNPTVSVTGTTSSVALQFDDFLNRSGRFGSLVFDCSDSSTAADSINANKVLVVEEFPTIMTRSSFALDSFRSVLLQHLAAGASTHPAIFDNKLDGVDHYPPLVMIITETLLTSTTAATDSFTAHRLLGPEISNHPLVTIMEFNPVAPTFVAKALDTVIKKEARDSKRRRMPGPAVLQRLAEIGDIRSAINSLEFLCVRGDDSADWSGTVAAKIKRASKDSIPLTSMEKDSLELVSQRETTLDMFHATGKVVYNKREDPRMADTRAEPPPKPPDHMMHVYKPKVSQVDIEALLNETGTDIQTFLSSLHENYVLSCNGNSFVESLEGCSNILSDSDLLNPDSRRLSRVSRSSGQQSYQTGGTDVLRQDEISFQVASRGLLFCLPFPVNRAAHPGGRKADSFKMFYPASLRLWKPTEEIESLITLFIAHSSAGQSNRVNVGTSPDGVASWAARASGEFFDSRRGTEDTADSQSTATALRTYSSRDELSLEILPYLARIKHGRREDTAMLNKITQLRGLRIVDPEAGEPFDDEPAADDVSTGMSRPQPSSAAPHSSITIALARFDQSQTLAAAAATIGPRSTKAGLGIGLGLAPEEVAMEKLYISDDDIQDD